MDTLKEQEIDKYKRVKAKNLELWGRAHKENLGLDLFRAHEKAYALLSYTTFIDIGCGDSRLMQYIADKAEPWPVVYGLDLVPGDNTENILQGCLWEEWPAKLWPIFDLGICCDVLEHIPTEKVDDVLEQMFLNCNNLLISIALRIDVQGDLIGERLHLTVKPKEWWYRKLIDHLPDGKILIESKYRQRTHYTVLILEEKYA